MHRRTGLPLIPWPNRIQDGAYRFDGVEYQVPLTEPENHNAIHGFLRWRNWTCRQHTRTTARWVPSCTRRWVTSLCSTSAWSTASPRTD